MRTKLGSVVVLAVALTACRDNRTRTDQQVTARANEQTASAPAAQSDQATNSVPSAPVTMIGCVQPANNAAKPSTTVQTDKSGNTATVEMADTKYMLTNASPMVPGEQTAGTSGTSPAPESNAGSTSNSSRPAGTTGTSSAPALGSSYRLEGQNGDASLDAEVGHRVQVTAIEELPPSGSPASVMPKLKVQEMKTIAAQCQ